MTTLFSEEVPSTQIPNVLTNRQPKEFLMDSIIDPSVIPIDQSLKLTPTAYVQNPMVFEPMKSAQQPSIVGGLFNPELRSAAEMDYLQKRQDAMKNEALTFAQLTPAQQAQFGFYRGGQQLGDAIGGALGGQDPQLRMIGLQQQILSELDPSDPQQQLSIAQKYARVAPELAMKIADSARKSLSELALEKQRTAEKMTPEQRNALAYADTVGARGTPEHTEAFKSRLEQLSVKPEATSTEMKNATALADSVAKRGTQTWNDKYNSELIRLTTKEPKERNIAFGTEAERKSKAMYGKPYADLTPTEAGLVDKAVEASEQAKATAGATVIPGVKEFKDIPKLRADIISTVKPFRDTVNSTDFALENLNLSIKQNNFSAFNAARVQLAKSLAGGDLSQKEIQAAGGDPSILGQLVDVTSTAFTGTPSIDTQKKIESTVKAIRKVALQKGRAEIEAQRTLAKRSNFTNEDFDLASDIPEFRTKPSGTQKDTGLSFDAEKEKRYQEWKAKQKGTTP